MRKYQCSVCKKEFKIRWWHVHTSWKPEGKHYKYTHVVTCPYCHFRAEISFWKMPIKAKIRFIKEALSFQ